MNRPINAIKIIAIVGIILFLLVLHITPFVEITIAGAPPITYSFRELAYGESTILMQGSKIGGLSWFPLISLVFALFLPNYQADSLKTFRRETMTLIGMTLSFAAALAMPLLQSAALILGGGLSDTNYLALAQWGTYLVTYFGAGLFLFFVLVCVPKLRKSIFAIEFESDTN